MRKNSVPLHPVISFSVINYVVSMRRPRVSGEVSFLFLSVPRKREIKHQSALRPVRHLDPSIMKRYCIPYYGQS